MALLLDLESYTLDDAAQYLEPVEAPGNYKDPAKIEAYIQEARDKALARCALDVDLGRIVCAAWQEDGDGIVSAIAKTEQDETLLLDRLWSVIGHHRQIVGYNVLQFDLPLIIRRSQYLGVQPLRLNLDRYRTPHADLQQILSFNGAKPYRSLNFYCRRFGLAVPDDHDGSDVAALVRAGNWDAVRDHCIADVHKVRLLAERIGVLPAPAEVL